MRQHPIALSEAAAEEFRRAKYGLMLHFGLYSLLGGEYRGKAGPRYAEWTACALQIPNREIEALAKQFDPARFDADEICLLAKRCGLSYIVFTAKHHEGFALFRSRADKFNSVDFSPARRDFVYELASACARHGLKFGVYYSQFLDWHEEHGGGYGFDATEAAGKSWDNSWDFPDTTKKNYDLCFAAKILPQVEELLTGYGQLFSFWFDTPLNCGRDKSEKLYSLVKKYQPDCLVNSRLGNGCYDYVSLGDNELPDSLELSAEENLNALSGVKPSPLGLYEAACTLNRSWGYAKSNPAWKSGEWISSVKRKVSRLPVNLLLNVGPKGDGEIPQEANKLLTQFEKTKP